MQRVQATTGDAIRPAMIVREMMSGRIDMMKPFWR
jgi:hypothetical protein